MGNLDQPSSDPAPDYRSTQCLSSVFTLFYRVFVPVFGTVFITGMVVALMVIPEEDLYLSFPAIWARSVSVLLLIGWYFFVKRTVWRLKRVDANDTHLFVTNYWQTARYPWSDVDFVDESRRMGRRLVHFHLKAPGRFGQVITILPASHYDELIRDWNVRKV